MNLACKVCGALNPNYTILVYKAVFSSPLSSAFDFAVFSPLCPLQDHPVPYIKLPSLALDIFSISFPQTCTFLSSSCTFFSSLIQILPHPYKRNPSFCQDFQPCKNLKVMKRRRESKLRKTHLFLSCWKEKDIP